MKHKFLFALALTSVLSFGAVSLASCGNEEIQDTTRYKVNYTANDAIYKVEGLKSDGYLEGEKVEDIISKLKGVECGNKKTSCADQLAKALETITEKSIGA